MAFNVKTREERAIREVEIVPNFIVWNWMISGLKLVGVDILIFAYIYSQSFDNRHYTTVSMTTLANWFGVTRQTLVKHIDGLPFIEKMASQDGSNGFYTFNYFKVNMDDLTAFMINSDHQVYSDFLDAYEDVLKAGFPKDKDTIHEYFKAFKEWHGGMGNDLLDTFSKIIRIGNELRYITKDYENVPFVEAVNMVCTMGDKSIDWTEILNGTNNDSPIINNIVNSHNYDDMINNAEANNVNTEDTSDDIDNTTEPVTPITESVITNNTPTKNKHSNKISAQTLMNRFGKSNKSKKNGLITFANQKKSETHKASLNEHIEKLKDIATNFVITEADNNSEVLGLLHSYVTAWGAKGITYDSFKASLGLLKDASLNIDDMVTFCKKAIAKNTKTLISTTDKQVQQNMNKKALIKVCEGIINTYVKNDADNNEELRTILTKYTVGILINKGKVTDAGQLHQHLETLSNCCKTTEEKLNSIKKSYMNGWLAMAYEGANNNSSNNSFANTSNSMEVDMEAKEKIIEEANIKYCFFLYPQIIDALKTYIYTTNNGKAMTADKFKLNLDFLMLHRFTIDDIMKAISDATLKDYAYLCLEDYKITNAVKQKFRTLEYKLEFEIRYRKQACIEAYNKNPNNEVLAANLDNFKSYAR